jgi:hypothetical protein
MSKKNEPEKKEEEAKEAAPPTSYEKKERYNGAPKSFWHPKLPVCTSLEDQLDQTIGLTE